MLSTGPDQPRLDGQVVVVTGGSTGLGYFTSEQLARLGAAVVIAARDADRAERASRSIERHVPGAHVQHVPLDLGRLDSVHAAGEQLAALPRIDALVANAAVVALPDWSKPRAERGHRPLTTADGLELHWGTNHLGHFALVAHLLPALLASGGRVVHVGSVIHSRVRQPADSLPLPEEPQSDLAKYARSKLAVMTFGFELARRLEAHRGETAGAASSVVAHPGTAVDALSPTRAIAVNQPDVNPVTRTLVRSFAHGKHRGAMPLVTAAASPEARNGDYWGPSGWKQLRGEPTRLAPHASALDPQVAGRLVARSEELAGVRLPL
ncbi:SDR family NAD(P)-dependent oxidoreductase [Humibacillus xanthopallidus]|uniref:NAD(P)-dependent dehydrogenase (Short-subunit alcohol dehydrogenase family) n=1 Tax=Humibacillus xanthopallidus TaxID=412689 RepID=A0A543I1N0_9MICO|nr:SDR family NAD(P)-dependent oxidoreductase [Humibacillus xanthopallidus]TQM64496.1 NAD(P)-dependent dehydrogenase (short-subunit alcohol dehydrogenase family) [Humibacillus xanthopallidus]